MLRCSQGIQTADARVINLHSCLKVARREFFSVLSQVSQFLITQGSNLGLQQKSGSSLDF